MAETAATVSGLLGGQCSVPRQFLSLQPTLREAGVPDRRLSGSGTSSLARQNGDAMVAHLVRVVQHGVSGCFDPHYGWEVARVWYGVRDGNESVRATCDQRGARGPPRSCRGPTTTPDYLPSDAGKGSS